ncbi:MAG: DUF4012 domain-containing protein [bacterium]|nr:DUF4012 domain-containing protein [bacterium]
MFKKFFRKKINLAQLEKLKEQAQDVFNNILLIKKKKRKNKVYKLIKYISWAILAFFVFFIIFLATNFFVIKQIYQETMSGKDTLEQAVVFIQMQNFDQAKALAQNSSNNFLKAIASTEQFKDSFFIKSLPYFKKQIDSAEYLLTATELLSRAVSQSASFGQNIKNSLSEKKLTFSKFSLEEKQSILQCFYQAGPELNGLKANITLALINLEQVNSNGLLLPFKNQINKLKTQLIQANLLLENIASVSEILPAIAGYPEKAKFLIILQNNDELRPTGGFIGTYGIMKVDSGDIAEFITHDIYHLDMPIKDKLKIAPPEPLKKYLGINNWYLRDANWSPDWPTSAKKIEWFYQIENKLNNQVEQEKFSGIIAITPQLIIDLLSIIGPIKIDNVVYDKNNFQELLQYKVERGYVNLGVSSWQRKEVIGEIAKELKIKLFDLPAKQWPEVLTILNNNLNAKNILIYLSDPIRQNLVKQRGWAGEIKNTKDDYLMVVDANVAAFKTDAVINRSLEYKVDQNSNGLFAKLKINYAHQGSFDWRTTRYRTWTRIYAPLGSQLIKTEGFVDNEVIITNELDKTSFGGFISIEPGKLGNVYLEYKLPDNLNKNNYNLYIQKQPGNDISQLTVDLTFLNRVKSYNPTTLYMQKINANQINWKGDLMVDKSFEVNF